MSTRSEEDLIKYYASSLEVYGLIPIAYTLLVSATPLIPILNHLVVATTGLEPENQTLSAFKLVSDRSIFQNFCAELKSRL